MAVKNDSVNGTIHGTTMSSTNISVTDQTSQALAMADKNASPASGNGQDDIETLPLPIPCYDRLYTLWASNPPPSALWTTLVALIKEDALHLIRDNHEITVGEQNEQSQEMFAEPERDLEVETVGTLARYLVVYTALTKLAFPEDKSRDYEKEWVAVVPAKTADGTLMIFLETLGAVPKLEDRMYFDLETDKHWFDIFLRKSLTPKGLNAKYLTALRQQNPAKKGKAPIKSASHYFSEWAIENKAKRYITGTSAFFASDEGLAKEDGEYWGNTYLNKQVPPNPRPTKEGLLAIKLWEFLIDDILCDNDEIKCEGLRWWLATVYQKRGKLWAWAPLIVGRQGIGKGVMLQLLKGVLGKGGVSLIPNENLTGSFNKDASSHRVVAVEELKIGSKDNNFFKNFITGETIKVNKKHIEEVTRKNHSAKIFNSNEPVPIPLGEGTRRIFAIKPKTVKATVGALLKAKAGVIGTAGYDKDYDITPKKLFKTIMGMHRGDLAKWLQDIDATPNERFHPMSEPPITDDLRDLQETSSELTTTGTTELLKVLNIRDTFGNKIFSEFGFPKTLFLDLVLEEAKQGRVGSGLVQKTILKAAHTIGYEPHKGTRITTVVDGVTKTSRKHARLNNYLPYQDKKGLTGVKSNGKMRVSADGGLCLMAGVDIEVLRKDMDRIAKALAENTLRWSVAEKNIIVEGLSFDPEFGKDTVLLDEWHKKHPAEPTPPLLPHRNMVVGID